MSHVSRRDLVMQIALTGCGCFGLSLATGAHAASKEPHVSVSTDPTALALHYVEDASKVDRQKFPTYQPGQMCATCLHLMGTPGDQWRPCELYPGRLVNAGGWCQVWAKKG